MTGQGSSLSSLRVVTSLVLKSRLVPKHLVRSSINFLIKILDARHLFSKSHYATHEGIGNN